MIIYFFQWIAKFPIELCILIVLIMITIYRRRLSSNHEYRGKKQARHKGAMRQPLELSAMLTTSSKRIVEEQPRKIYQMIRSLPKKISTTIDEQIFLNFDENADDSSDLTTRSILSVLTPELIFHILHFLPTDDIVRMGLTSRKYYNLIILNNVFWEHLWVQTYSYLWNHHAIRKIRQEKHIYWDPLLNYPPPQAGWFYFYLLFENCWMDWLLAGLNTPQHCVVVIKNNWYDVTEFLGEHPGSPETLSEGAGSDGSDLFEDISHTSYARELMQRFCICAPAEEYRLLLQRNNASGERWAYANAPAPGESGRFSSFDSTTSSIVPLLPYEDTSGVRLYTPEKAKSRLKGCVKALQAQLSQLALAQFALLAQGDVAARDKYFNIEAGRLLQGMRVGFFPACEHHQHHGTPKAVLEPLTNEWFIWWTCCAMAYPVVRMPKQWAAQQAAYGLMGYEATA